MTISQSLGSLIRRLTSRMRRPQRAAELDEELALHLDLLARDLRLTGLSERDALDAAHRQIGNHARIAEATWESMGVGVIDTIARDLRYSLRGIRKTPGYAITVVLTLALGIGATVAVYSVLNHVLLQPIVYPNSDRLVVLYQKGAQGNRRLVSYPTLRDWQLASPEFDRMAYVRGDAHVLKTESGLENVVTAYVSSGFFALMGVKPEIGRTFAADEERPSGVDAVVLSHDLWARIFGSDVHVLGHTIRLDSGRAVIIGVMPRSFAYPSWAAVWRPLAQRVGRDSMLEHRDFHADSRAIGRLRLGVNVTRASLMLSAVQQRIGLAFPVEEGTWNTAELVPLRKEVLGDVSSSLWALAGAVALILLIACVNVANLTAVRGASRGREIAVRLALGASRTQVMRQLLTETLVLAVAGALLGVAGARGTIAWLRAAAPFDLPRAEDIAVDGHALIVAALLTVMTAALFGVLPAMRSGAPDGAISRLLGVRSDLIGTREQARVRGLLTGAQFALAVVLLVGAGLLLQSYRRLQAARLGFEPRGLYGLRLYPPKEKYSGDERATLALYQRLIERLRTEPGVEEAAFVNFMPLGAAGVPTRLEIAGRALSSDDIATYITVSAGYLRAMHIPLLQGRWFSGEEMRSPDDGVVISDALAKRYWPSGDAIGKAITIFRSSQDRADFGKAAPSVVIGVVGSVRQYGPEDDPDGAVYVPLSAEPWPWGTLIVRERGRETVTRAALKRAIEDIEPQLVTTERRGGAFDAVEGSMSQILAPRRYILALLGAFSISALVLAAVGIYGVTSYSVTRRAQELGIRRALGAAERAILATVLLQGIAPALVGCVIGIAGSFAAAGLLKNMLYETSTLDPVVLIGIPLVLLLVGLIACYFPARRALRIDPLSALRGD